MNPSLAKRGDLIAVTGTLGGAAISAKKCDGASLACVTQNVPIAVIKQIEDFAHVYSKISDGLLKDLTQVCRESQLGAKISLEQIPVDSELKKTSPDWSHDVLTDTGDDQWFFLFDTQDLHKLPEGCSIIGQMGCGNTVKVFVNNQEISIKPQGLVHFNHIEA